MFTSFHKNKLSSDNRGQLAPIFIVVLVILLIMTMVTVNLSKVSIFKTSSANAVDAGGLAAGSVMANVFNGVAQANSQFETIYWEFYASISVSFVLAYKDLIAADLAAAAALASATSAASTACPAPCAAIGLASSASTSAGSGATAMQNFVLTNWAILIAVTAFSIAQYYFYLSLRRSSEDGWENAMEIGHKFVFMNSDVGSKLKAGSPPDGVTAPEYKNNYRNEFSDFLENRIGHNSSYQYLWKDNQERSHYVHSTIDIDPIDTFDFLVAVMPLPVELALLYKNITLGETAALSLTMASVSYAAASVLLSGACACQSCCGGITAPVCCPCWLALCASAVVMLSSGMGANSTAIATMKPIYYITAIAWAGLLPGFTFRDSGSLAAMMFTICWIDDIVHNRKVRVDSWQHHEGASLGLWDTRYPEIHSFSIIDFTGRGKIHPPKLRHDASIVVTDIVGAVNTSTDPSNDCPYVVNRIPELEKQIDNWLAAADSYEESAQDIKKQADKLRLGGFPDEADDLMGPVEKEGTVANLRQKAIDARDNADYLQEEIENLKETYPHCF